MVLLKAITHGDEKQAYDYIFPVEGNYRRRKPAMTATVEKRTRMSWDEIVQTYPDMWVGLIDVDWKNEANVRSAIVAYTDDNADELLRMQFEDEIECSLYTTPDNLGQLGVLL